MDYGYTTLMDTRQPLDISPISSSDRTWVVELISKSWGSNLIITRGKIYDAKNLPGFIAVKDDQRIGLLTYAIAEDQLEIISLVSLVEKIGVGIALIDTALEHAQNLGCHRIWVITTNDNLPALGFYQKRGFHLAALHRNALDNSRKLKTEIPLVGLGGIPVRDEIELEYILNR